MSRGLPDQALEIGDTVVCINGASDTSYGLYKDREYKIRSVGHSSIQLFDVPGSWFKIRFEKVDNFTVITEPSEDIYNDLI